MRQRRDLVVLALTMVWLAGPVGIACGQQSAEDELAVLRAAPGIDVSLFAAEPLITNPAAIDVDTQGRVWVAEIEFYRRAAKDPPADKIVVLEDTDDDGRADRSTVFAEGVFCPMSICVAWPRVFVATSPDLWVYEDRDNDLKADGPPQKVLTGFGGHNHDHGAHSLVLGPDHRWWMSHGDAGFDVTGTDGSRIAFRWGAVMRGELDFSQLELAAVNFRNPYEVCVSSFGEAFLSDNDNDGNFSTRICWLLEGGNYGWFGKPPAKVPSSTPWGEGWHFRSHLPGFVPGTLVTGFGSPCGICFYEGDAFGPQLKNAPLHADAGPREVRIYPHELEGAGLKATSEVILTSEGDDYFRPDDVCAAPDGSLYVADWYDGGVGGHAYDNPGQGRIFQLRPTDKSLARVGKPGLYENVDDAIEGLKNPNLATQFLARERLLAAGDEAVEPLLTLLDDADANFRARALWVLDRIGGQARQTVLDQLSIAEASFRALGVRILRQHGDEYAEPILALADDPSAEVRREVLLALRDLRGPQAEEALLKLAAAYDGNDRYLLEAIHIAAADREVWLRDEFASQGMWSLDNAPLLYALDDEDGLQLYTKYLEDPQTSHDDQLRIVRRLGGIASFDVARQVVGVAHDAYRPIEVRRQALEIVNFNLVGPWQTLAKDGDSLAALRDLLADQKLQEDVVAMAGRHRLESLAGDVLTLAKDADTPQAVRLEAIRAAATLRATDAAALLESLLADGQPAEIRSGALHGLVVLEHWRPLLELLNDANTPPAQQAATARELIGTSSGALVLLKLLDDGSLAEPLRQDVLDRAMTHSDTNIRTLFERFVPEERRPKRLGSAVRPEEILALEGDALRGQEIFLRSSAARCNTCHVVNGKGGQLGPDLSQIGRKYERAALLETILDPSKAMAPEYVPHLVQTEDGRVLVGFIIERNENYLVLKDAESKLIRIAADDVAATAPQTKSLMPELVLQDVTAQDAADLLAYMSSLKAGGESDDSAQAKSE